MPEPSVTDNSRISWTQGITGNPDGIWMTRVGLTSQAATGILVKEQGGYGIINARLLFDGIDDSLVESQWTCANQGSQRDRSMRFPGQRIVKIQVREQSGYGLVDLRFWCANGDASDWLTKNPNGTALPPVEFAEAAPLVGLQGKEQSRYGLVDIRFGFTGI